MPACHGSALAGFEAFPPRPAHPTLAGSGRPDPQTLPRPGASPGAVLARSASLPAGIRFRERFRNVLCVSRGKGGLKVQNLITEESVNNLQRQE